MNIEQAHKNRDYGKTFDELIIENENFAYSVVHKEYAKTPWNIKDDLLSAAKEGLIYAATKFDNTQENNNFCSYAVNWIRYYIQEELRKIYPIRLNQNYVSKRKKIVKALEEYKKEYNTDVIDYKYISEKTGYSEKIIKNVLGNNEGDFYHFYSLQSLISENNSKNSDDGGQLENKMINEYLNESKLDQGILNTELNDLLNELKKRISDEDYKIFIDKHLNGLSYSDIAKKYKLNFPATASYRIKCIEKICKKLAG